MVGLNVLLLLCTLLADLVNAFQRGDVRLVNGDNEYEGRVEIFLNGEWGTIDDDPWDNNDANVVCRQLGYTLGGVAHKDAHYGEGSGPIWLDNIGCFGTEENLLSCPHQNDTSEDSHSEDAGVACNGKVRLANGNGPDEGRVEIFKDGQWGTVDDDPWNDIDAGVVCRELGYLHGGAAFGVGHFGQGSGPIWLDDINCVGNEARLMNCAHGTDTSEDNHNEDVGVRCAWKVRLVNGLVPSEGRVEVLIHGKWGTIKDNGWDNNDANVVCYQLGYPSGGIAYSGAYFGKGSGPALLENVQCAGTESSLFRCSHQRISVEGCHNQDAGVACFDLSTEFCSSQPCANNGKCVNEPTSFLCLCSPGFSGTRCENAINPCDSNPCENSGLCIRQQSVYRCICPDGYDGSRCEINQSIADSDPCGNRDCKSSDNCIERLNYRYCSCPGPFNNTVLCQYDIDKCYKNPCKEGETCQPRGNSFDCVSAEKITYTKSGEQISSYISLVLAVLAILAVILCFIKLYKIQQSTTNHASPSAAVPKDGSHVPIHLEQHQDYHEVDSAVKYNKL